MTIVLSSFRARLQAYEREIAVEALQATNGGIKRAAELCGVHPYHLRRIIKRHHLETLTKPHSGERGNLAWLQLGDA